VPRAELACGRVGDDGDVMAVQPVKPALRLLLGWAACMDASCCACMAWRIAPPHALVAVLVPRVWAHTPVEAETSRARRRLVMEAETCRGGPSSGEPVGDAANWPKTGRLASVGLDQGL
jgi:hypothetical protein